MLRTVWVKQNIHFFQFHFSVSWLPLMESKGLDYFSVSNTLSSWLGGLGNNEFCPFQRLRKYMLDKQDCLKPCHLFIYLFISFFFNLGDPFNALALFFLRAQSL